VIIFINRIDQLIFVMEKYVVFFEVRTNFVAQEPEGSSPHSQQPATGPYSEPAESNPPPPSQSPRSILIPSSHLRLGLPSGLFPSGFSTKTLYTFEVQTKFLNVI
jgi:hypothetical protein